MSVVASFQSMPRALKWAVFAIVFMILFFAAVEPALGYLDRVNARADALRIQLDDLQQQLRDRESNMAALSRGLQEHGPAVAPARAAVRAEAIETLFSEVTSQIRTMEGWQYVPGELGFGSETLAREFIERPSDELVRLTFNISFEASPEDAMEAIARFEASPAVQSISSLRIVLGQQGRRTLGVQMTLESWAIRERGRR